MKSTKFAQNNYCSLISTQTQVEPENKISI